MNKVKIVSFHPSKTKADIFADELKQKGAEGVEVGESTSAGFPVTSVVDEDLANVAVERCREHTPETREDYGYETTAVPVLEEIACIEMEGGEPVRSDEDILDIFWDEVRRIGLHKKPIKIRGKVSRYQGRDTDATYCDATLFKVRRGIYVVHIHPYHRYTEKDTLRDSIRHELRHIQDDLVGKANWGE